MANAKAHLSELLEVVESGGEVVITRRGKPVAQLVPLEEVRPFDWDALREWVSGPPTRGKTVAELHARDEL
ncbi:MAG: type II toxin-antitoxin system Phd/YefM family antitoxin [Gammaproteobacteria bacterium]